MREAVLNAVSHRDYREPGSVFIRQYPRKLEIVSPGGFPVGINADNILWEQKPRNRRIAEAFQKCGLVERAGQGADRMFGECVKESKPQPDFAGTSSQQVSVTLHGEVQNPDFLRFLEAVGNFRLADFSTRDFLVLDAVFNDRAVTGMLKPSLSRLEQQGVLEAIGRGSGKRYILSRQFYGFIRKKGAYTRKRGLDRETNKTLLWQHISDNLKDGSPLSDLMQVLPGHSRGQVQTLLRDLRTEGRARNLGTTRGSRWYPGPAGANSSNKNQPPQQSVGSRLRK